MIGEVRQTTVAGIPFEVWSDFTLRATLARRSTDGEVKAIHKGGYIKADLTVRKAIAKSFAMKTFRK